MLNQNPYRFDEERSLPSFFKAKEVSPEKVEEFLDQDDNGNPGAVRVAIPKEEFKHYKRIQNLGKKYLPRFRESWNEAKPKIAEVYAEENGIEVKKVNLDLVAEGLALTYKLLRDEFSSIADLAFADGINAGNKFFEDSFKVKGFDSNQVNSLKKQYGLVFDARSQNLFENQALSLLDDRKPSTLDGIIKTLDSFDRYLLQYSGIASAVAYEVFANATNFLNQDIVGKFGDISLFGSKPFALQWVLGEVATKHSPDCLLMSRGDFELNGIGVWGAEELAATGLTPRSDSLDCGGNCHCHLHPIAFDTDNPDDNNLLNSFTTPVRQLSDTFNITPNMSVNETFSLFDDKGWLIPPSLRESISSVPFFRRREFWENIPVRKVDAGVHFNFINRTDEGWTVGGLTTVRGLGGNVKPAKIDIDIEIPQSVRIVDGDIPFADIPAPILEKINQVLAHEMGHTFWYNVPDFAQDVIGKEIISTIFDDSTLRRIRSVVNKEYEFHIAKVNAKVKKSITDLGTDTISPDLRPEVERLRDVFDAFEGEEFTDVLRFLNKSILEDTPIILKVGNVDTTINPHEILNSINVAFRKLGINSDLISEYQLYSPDEFWGEFVGLLATNPQKARLHNERLTNVFKKEFADFGENTLSKNELLVPDQISINQLIDVPDTQVLDPFPSNTSFRDILKDNQVISTARNLSDKNARAQVRRVFEKFPTLLRNEFFGDDAGIQFLSKTQMRREAGTSRFTAFLDPETNTVNINLDKWKGLTTKQRAELFADLASDKVSQDIVKIEPNVIGDAWSKTLEDVLIDLEMKVGRQGVRKEVVDNLRVITTSSNDVWVDNFDLIASIIENIPDLPIRNIQSLRDPESFFREFFKGYITKGFSRSQFERDLRDSMGKTFGVGASFGG
jgi:hypothetical protein